MTLSRRHALAATLAAPLFDRGLAQTRIEAPRALDAKPGMTGPTLRLKKGEELRLRLANSFAHSTALHFQGVRLANAMDGAVGLTQKAVEPGASFDYRFVPPDSGFFWYRASAMPRAAEQRARGLFGALVVEEPSPPDVDADMTLVIDDWSGVDPAILEAPFLDPLLAAGAGRMGPGLFVNGGLAPLVTTQRPGARLRLRLLNACNARLIAVAFDEGAPLVIAIDGQPCDPFTPLDATLPLAPGARFDVLFNVARDASLRPRVMLLGEAKSQANRDLLVVTMNGEPGVERPEFAGLPANPLLPTQIRLQNAARKDIEITGPFADDAQIWKLAGGAGAVGARPLLSVKRGRPVSLGFVNKTPILQTMHVHGHVMRLLHLLDDGWEPYWRDTATILPGKTVRVAFVADNPGKWLIESAILDHAATGAAAWFDVA